MRPFGVSMALILFAVVCVPASSQTARPSENGIAFFENKIRPMLAQHCYKCHSAKTKRPKGGLLLDTKAGVHKGGETGPIVIVGKAKESLLVKSLHYNGDLKMPPNGKLPESVIADFERWINMGAPDPRDGKAVVVNKGIDIEKGRAFWAFQPLAAVQPPILKNPSWARTAIDHFILARQREKGITPNGKASRRTLIRRAYFDLVGLPPTPEEVADFLSESEASPQAAYEKLIDRLLASEHYGERWARHWLDVARFAESNGYAFDRDRPAAYHYRDFVIKALNSDMPFDHFVRWQIAGDQIAPEKYMAIAATGFIVAGPFTTQQTAKERERSRYEQLDDMIHTVGTSMLGLSVGCARCHDHKYDPVAMQDYYRMAACFADVGFADIGFDKNPEATRKAKALFDKAHAPLVADRNRYEKEKLPGALEQWIKSDYIPKPTAPNLSVWHTIGPFKAKNFDTAFDKSFGPENGVDLKKAYQKGKIKWTSQPTWTDGKVHNTLKGGNSANYLFRTIETKTSLPVQLSLGADDGVRVWLNGREIATVKKSRAQANQIRLETMLSPGKNELLLKIANAGGTSGFYFQVARLGPPANVTAILKNPTSGWNPKQKDVVSKWFAPLDSEWQRLDDIVKKHLQSQPKPKLTKIYAAKQRGTTYQFGANTYKVFLLGRGNVEKKQGEAAPGFLRVLMTSAEKEKHWIAAADKKTEPAKAREPRVALADWITDTKQGAGHLLARVIVNRLWQHHFGRGIVATPNNFGARGEPPTHPLLLDWLANRLIEGGWKLKPIHKLIMTSAVYTQETSATPGNLKADLQNKTFWRRIPNRLEAEVIRDALLFVSGNFDATSYGPGSRDARSKRRSVYLTVKRGDLDPFLQLFDAPDAMQSVGHRSTTTVPPQALAMMNSPFVRDLAKLFAQRIRPDSKTSIGDAIRSAYAFALSRQPMEQEHKRMREFIAEQTKLRGANAAAENQALTDFCHVLLCMNEFIYID